MLVPTIDLLVATVYNMESQYMTLMNKTIPLAHELYGLPETV